MTNEQREAIRQCELYVQAKATIQLTDEINGKLVFKSYDTSAIETVLNMLKEKDKMIDLMIKQLYIEGFCREIKCTKCNREPKQCFKQYFAGLVEKETDLGTKTFCDYQIETILTHEQYDQNCYKVKEREENV